jgi:hypothetical protein
MLGARHTALSDPGSLPGDSGTIAFFHFSLMN